MLLRAVLPQDIVVPQGLWDDFLLVEENGTGSKLDRDCTSEKDGMAAAARVTVMPVVCAFILSFGTVAHGFLL